MRIGARTFREVWAIDWEFTAPPGANPRPICVVARELCSGRTVRLFGEELSRRPAPPYPIGDDVLLVAYYASAEIGCHLALGWGAPAMVLDLFTEFRVHTNGRPPVAGNGLLGALLHFGLDAMDATEKEGMRARAMRGARWTAEERVALLAYCEADVQALERLLPCLLPGLDERALLRGRYMIAAARMEHCGVPIDVPLWHRLRGAWPRILERLVARVDADFGVYEGKGFRAQAFARYLVMHGIPWPRTARGALALDEDTFRMMARRYPPVEPLRQLRATLADLRPEDLAVGPDGRNRCLLSAFRSMTGRNQPRSSQFIFGRPAWYRGLIQPRPDTGVAYLDYAQQEFGIAAALSGDPRMLAAYRSGDPYLAFARQAGQVPPDATKATHGGVRERFKACALGVQYGMGAEALAAQIGCDPAQGRELLEAHRATYPVFWRWSDAAVDTAYLHGVLSTVFGWPVHLGPDPNPRSVRNFPMQANGAEMLRLACCLATERGVRVCAPVHDAVLIEASAGDLEAAVAATQAAMADASAIVLGGILTLRV